MENGAGHGRMIVCGLPIDVFGHCDGAAAGVGHPDAGVGHHHLRLVDDTAVVGWTSYANPQESQSDLGRIFDPFDLRRVSIQS